MPRFIHSVTVPNVAIPGGTVTTWDLPVNPLSYINLVLQWTTGTAHTTIANILGMITQIEVLFKGSAVFSANGIDAYTLARCLLVHPEHEDNMTGSTTEVRWLSIPILFGRIPFAPEEAFPASQRGALQLRITWGALHANVADLLLLVESCELPEATPTHFIKATTLTQTAVIGQMDLELPIGNRIHAIHTWQTTRASAAAWVNTIAHLEILADNTQVYFTSHFWEGARANMQYNVDPQYRLEALGVNLTDTDLACNLWLLFDVLKDGQYIFNTEGLASFVFRYDAEAADAIRVIPVEVLTVAG